MRRTGIIAGVLLACASMQVAAQEPDSDLAISPQYRARILDAVAARIDTDYFNAGRAALIRARLTSKAVRATYDTCSTGARLSTALTHDLQAWSSDRHLRVFFSAEPHPLAKDTSAAPVLANEQAEIARSRNFGFYAIERLTGNVGYIEIGRFYTPAEAAPTLAAAMQFVANTDALIIDLRTNGGGRADMVAFMTSYFLDEQTRLATLERRNADASDQIWSAAYVPGPRYLDRPIYMLTSARTFSGAEGLAYDLKHFARATLVGEKTRGGANPGSFLQIDEHFAVFVPTARVVHAATGTNWDADGIAPDHRVAAKDAKLAALKLALEKLMADHPKADRFSLWQQAFDDLFPKQQP